MLPPVSMSQPSYQGVAAPETGLRGEPGRSVMAETARVVRPEIPTAVDAARRAAGLERIKGENGRVSEDQRPPPEDAPTGPPPTFDETPLQRQARLALSPPKSAENRYGDPQGSATISADTATGPSPTDRNGVESGSNGEAVTLQQFNAARGFSEARADFAAPTTPTIDRTA